VDRQTISGRVARSNNHRATIHRAFVSRPHLSSLDLPPLWQFAATGFDRLARAFHRSAVCWTSLHHHAATEFDGSTGDRNDRTSSGGGLRNVTLQPAGRRGDGQRKLHPNRSRRETAELIGGDCRLRAWTCWHGIARCVAESPCHVRSWRGFCLVFDQVQLTGRHAYELLSNVVQTGLHSLRASADVR